MHRPALETGWSSRGEITFTFCRSGGDFVHPSLLWVLRMNPWRSAIRNHCPSSKPDPKPNLKQGLKKTAGGESVGQLSRSLSRCLEPPSSLQKSTHEPSNAHLQRAHPAPLPFEVEFPPTRTDTVPSVQLRDLFLGEESGEGRQERECGLKGEKKGPNSRNPPASTKSDTLWNTRTMAQWKKSPLILLLITQKSLCSKALYTFFPFCASALSWEWLVSSDKSPYFILSLQGCCFRNNHLTVIPSRLAVNPRFFGWCAPPPGTLSFTSQ